MEARRELDALVAEKVMGWTVTGGPPMVRFSRDIDAAWLVVDWLKAQQRHLLCGSFARGETPWEAVFTDKDGHLLTAWCGAETAPLAICLAALAVAGHNVD